MRTSRCLLVFLLLAAAPAAAQPAQPEPMPGDTPVEETPPAEPAPTPTPPSEPPPAPAPAPEPEAARPEAFSLGIGAGYNLPADVTMPNAASARFRLPMGLVLEPVVGFAYSKDATEVAGADIENRQTLISALALVRWPLMMAGKFDFEVVGGGGLLYTVTNPDGANNDTTQTTLTVSWGLGVSYWITRHWTLSATALNPLFSYTKANEEIPPDMETNSTSTDIAVIWAPDILVMIHLYY